MFLRYFLADLGRFLLVMAFAIGFHTMEIYLRIGCPACASYITDAIVFIAEYHASFSFVLSIRLGSLISK
jgi:hypothetical protein